MHSYTIEELETIPMFFIVGSGRSGTTLLQTILNSHSNVVCPIESKLIIHLHKKYKNIKEWNNKVLKAFIKDLYKEIKFSNTWHASPKTIENLLLSYSPNELNFTIVCKLVYLQFPQINNKNKVLLIGDKNPGYVEFIPQIFEIFPKAKFIHIVRNYKAVIASSKKLKFRNNVLLLAHLWVKGNNDVDKIKTKFPNQFITLKYENLIKNSKKELSLICNFLEVDFEEQMLNYHQDIKKTKIHETNKLVQQFHPNLIKPINNESLEKWRAELSWKEIDQIEFIVGDFGIQYGYFQENEHPLKSYYISSLKSKITIYLNSFITKIYYNHLPFWVRDTIRYITKKLFKWFKLKSVYNKNDFHFEE